MQTIPFIIVQASGRGKRMHHLTNNRPKALISVFAEPLLLRVMSLYNNSHFIILGNYQFAALKTYLSTYASNKNYTLIKTAGATIGSNAGIKTALSGIPANTPFMILWCDLLHQKPINFSNFDIKHKNYLGLSDSSVCRWRYRNGLLEEKSSRQEGVVGIYIFAKKNILEHVPARGEFCEFLQKEQITFTPFIAKDVQEVGTLRKFSKIINTRPVTRPFNVLEVSKKTVTKFPTNQQGIDLAKDESNWYNTFKDKRWDFLPRMYSLSPLTLQKIDGKALYLTRLTLSEKEKVLKQIIKNLKTIHNTFSPKTKEYAKNNYEAYLEKTKRRLDSVASLIPHIEKEYLVINNQKCFNFYKFWPKIEELIKPYFTNTYVPIHGDCTFSNILYEPLRKKVYFIDPRGYFGQEKVWGDPDYDWAKLYYSLIGNYDQFNHKNFKLLIGKDKINLSIKTNGYSQFLPLFFKLTKANSTKMHLLHAIIWLSLSAYSSDDYDAICGAFYNGIYLLNQE